MKMGASVKVPLGAFICMRATRIEAEERAGLERLCGYVTRPPLATGRLQCIEADHLTFRLKTPWSDGTTHLLLSPLELIEKLAALIPPPRLNRVRYHGILAPNARHRSQVVPAPPSPPVSPTPGASLAASTGPPRISWAAFSHIRSLRKEVQYPRYISRIGSEIINPRSATGFSLRIWLY